MSPATNKRPSNLLHMRPRRGSLLPNSFSSQYDIKKALQTNAKSFVGREWVTLRSFPCYLKICIQQFRREICLSSGRPPGINTIITCCLHNGLRLVAEHGQVKRLQDLKSDLYGIRDEKLILEVEELHFWFENFHAGLSSGAVERKTISMPMDIKDELATAAGDLGMYMGDILVLSVMLSLRAQDDTVAAYRSRIDSTVVEFFRRVRVRITMAESMLETMR
jgi:hypothetical protein